MKADNGMLRVPKSQVDAATLQALTYTDEDLQVERVLYRSEGDDYLLPRGCARKFGLDVSTTNQPKMVGVEALPPVVLRDYQVGPVDVMTQYLRENHGGILEAKGGTGKTVMALEIARRLGVSTLVLVHTGFLLRQWIKRISTGDPENKIAPLFPGCSVGIAQQGQLDSGKDFSFVIGMVHTVTRRPDFTEWANSFGLVITDEVHRYGAESWASAITMFNARYRLGLTGTVERSDGKEVVFLAHIGRVAVKVHAETLQATVYPVKMETALARKDYIQPWDKKINLARLINALAVHKKRQATIAEKLKQAAKSGRKVLVLSDRLVQLEDLKKRLAEDGYESAMYVGGMKEAALDAASKSSIILTTYPMSLVALDIPSLDTLFLTTPRSEVTQAVWRVTRLHSGKKSPLVVDFVDTSVQMLLGMYKARLKRYRAQRYVIRE